MRTNGFRWRLPSLSGLRLVLKFLDYICVLASETDETMRTPYYASFRMRPFGDIREVAACVG